MAYTIELEVIRQKGHCELGHKVGDVIICTEEGVEGRICFHALYSVVPKVFAMMYDANFHWLENPDVTTHACPDADNPVVFELRRFKKSD